MSHSFSHNINSFNTIAADDRPNILAWLSPLDPRLWHKDIRDRRVENVGEWLVKTEEFRRWCDGSGGGESENSVLFCYGDPGVGKTYISSLVIDRLCDRAEGENSTVACFYFDFATQKEQSPTNMLGALLKQLVCGLEEIPEEISRAYKDQKASVGGREPGLSDIVKMLQTTSSKKRTFVCIDALDECVAGDRVKVLNSLNQILQKTPGARVLVTGRPHIRPEIARRLSGRVTSVSISPKRDDIIRYLHTKLDEDTIPDAMDSSLEADILKKFPEEVSEIFLLVSLNIDAILQETTIHRRRRKLNAMTNGLGLGDAYGATLGRIKGQGGEKARLGMAALMWISHSERPLKTEELCHALAVEIGSVNLNSDNVPSIGTLLACGQGLFTVDKEASTVRLIHFTLQEYLRGHPDLFGTAQATMAETCLSYLNSQQVKALSARPSHLQDMPFLEYSSQCWGTHARRDLSHYAKSLALKLFDDYNNHVSIEILLGGLTRYHHVDNSNKRLLFSGLHCASLFGIVEIVTHLVEMEGCDINQNDYVGITPLLWASCNGHEGVVKLLLGRDDISPEKTDNDGRTPLCYAALCGQEGVVKILLERDDVSPDKSSFHSITPLGCAAMSGHEEVVKILLGRDGVNPDQPDDMGRTPLLWGAYSGHESVVRVLLGRDDVNPDWKDNFGSTPLRWAAWNGHEGVMRLLLARDDVNPDQKDSIGWTPLEAATRGGQAGAAALLQPRASATPSTT